MRTTTPPPVRTTAFSLMQAVKRRFFAMRNGDLAAQMAAGGIVHKINFGLNLPQIKEIAEAALAGTLPGNPHLPTSEERRELAHHLWENRTTRESRLIAPMLMNAEEISAEVAAEMLADCATTEEADILCHRLLRLHTDAMPIAASTYAAATSDMQRYASLRLMMNLLSAGKGDMPKIRQAAEKELGHLSIVTRRLARQIIEEADFLTEP